MQLHAIGILTSSWGGQVFFEAMKFWFYAISCSILCLSYQLLLLRDDEKLARKPGLETTKDFSDGKSEKEKAAAVKTKPLKVQKPRSVLLWQLVGASCDLLIPGTFVGWLDVSPAVVAACSIFSSGLSSIEIWKRVNGN